jgi:CMP-N-acetylneuraminic acid synthetase
MELAGRPMLAWTVRAAIESGLSDSVYVCTECPEIAKIASLWGAIPFIIKPELAGDLVNSCEPTRKLLAELGNKGPAYAATLQPSSPLRTAEDIITAFQLLTDSRDEFLISVTSIDPHFFHWAYEKHEGQWRMVFGDEYRKERPLLPPRYRPNGAIKMARSESLMREGNYLFHNRPLGVYEMPEERSVHVATHFDFVCAEALLSRQSLHSRRDQETT